jgi:DNA polymerase-3 subunit epsilon
LSKPFVHLSLIRPLALVDVETTGLAPKIDRIIEVAVIRILPNGERQRYQRRLDPGIPIPATATALHGITHRDIVDCPSFPAIAASLGHFLRNCDLCGFNIKRFDLPFLLAEFARCGMRFSLARRSVIDVYEIYHQREPRNLSAAVRFYLDRAHSGAHGAMADAYASAAVLDAQLLRYTDLPRAVAPLHARFAGAELTGRLREHNGELTLTFGRYAGRSLQDVAQSDPDYLRCLLGEDGLPDFCALVERALTATVHDS